MVSKDYLNKVPKLEKSLVRIINPSYRTKNEISAYVNLLLDETTFLRENQQMLNLKCASSYNTITKQNTQILKLDKEVGAKTLITQRLKEELDTYKKLVDTYTSEISSLKEKVALYDSEVIESVQTIELLLNDIKTHPFITSSKELKQLSEEKDIALDELVLAKFLQGVVYNYLKK